MSSWGVSLLLENPTVLAKLIEREKALPRRPESLLVVQYLELLQKEPSAIRFGFTGLQGTIDPDNEDEDDQIIPSMEDTRNPIPDYLVNNHSSLLKEAAISSGYPSLLAHDDILTSPQLESLRGKGEELPEVIAAYGTHCALIQQYSRSVGIIRHKVTKAFRGTGFICCGKVVTSGHVAFGKDNQTIPVTFELGPMNFDLTPFNIGPCNSAKEDIAVFTVDNEDELPQGIPLLIQNKYHYPNAPCVVVGYPAQPHNIESQELIDRKFPGLTPDAPQKRHSLALLKPGEFAHGHTGCTLRGSSGSPLIFMDPEGSAVGVIGINRSSGNADMNVAVRSNILHRFLQPPDDTAGNIANTANVISSVNISNVITINTASVNNANVISTSVNSTNVNIANINTASISFGNDNGNANSGGGGGSCIIEFFESLWNRARSGFTYLRNSVTDIVWDFFRYLGSFFGDE